jgi:predicted permease
MLALPSSMDDPIRYYRRNVTPGYFDALRIPIVAGREFETRDDESAPRVALISEAGARRLWPNENPVGKQIMLSNTASAEIIGVAGNARFRDLTTDLSTSEPDVYFALAQQPSTTLEIIVRSRVAPASLTGQVREVVRALDPSLPVYAEAPMRDLLRQQTAAGRFGTMVLGTFSIIALILAAVGIYGVLSFLVGASRREIAIRMALGAASSSVLSLVVRRGLGLALIGLVIGLVGATFASSALASQLFGVGSTDPVTFAGVSAALLAVALMASLLPARKAMRIEPQSALKME